MTETLQISRGVWLLPILETALQRQGPLAAKAGGFVKVLAGPLRGGLTKEVHSPGSCRPHNRQGPAGGLPRSLSPPVAAVPAWHKRLARLLKAAALVSSSSMERVKSSTAFSYSSRAGQKARHGCDVLRRYRGPAVQPGPGPRLASSWRPNSNSRRPAVGVGAVLLRPKAYRRSISPL